MKNAYSVTGKAPCMLLVLTMLCASTFVVGFRIVKGSGTIYIREDGSVDGTDKIQKMGAVYTFTDNVSDSIIVEKSGIVIDGSGYTLQAGTTERGIDLTGRSAVTVRNVRIVKCLDAIRLSGSTHNNIIANTLTDNSDDGIDMREFSDYNSIVNNTIVGNHDDGIELWESSRNDIAKNNVSQNRLHGIWIYDNSNHNDISENVIVGNRYDGIDLLSSSNNNTVRNNTIENNQDEGITVQSAHDNSIYHNSFLNNTNQVSTNSVSNWDNGYPSGGNYWSDCNSTDLYSGLYQNVTGGDGIGDTPYIIDAQNQDDFPLLQASTSGGFDMMTLAIVIAVVVVCISGTAVLILLRRKHITTSMLPPPPPPPSPEQKSMTPNKRSA